MKISRLYIEEQGLLLLLRQGAARNEWVELLKEHLKNQVCLCTSALAVYELERKDLWQEGSRNKFSAVLREFEEIFEEILPIDYQSLRQALSLQKEHLLNQTQALHVAIVHGHGIEAMAGLSEPYSRVPLAHFFPLPAAPAHKPELNTP